MFAGNILLQDNIYMYIEREIIQPIIYIQKQILPQKMKLVSKKVN